MEDYRVQYLQSSHKAVDAKNLGFLLIEQLLTKYIYIYPKRQCMEIVYIVKLLYRNICRCLYRIIIDN